MGSLFVVSDVHGYRDDLARVLGSAGLVDEAGRWTGGEDELWVLGDLTDRGPDGIGTVDLMMSLQQQAPDQVHVLLGNHEALAPGMRRFPESRFAHSWHINGGRRTDQEGLTPAHVEWLSGLPALALVRDFLLVHSDTDEYLGWGDSVEGINATVRELLASDDVEDAWEVWARLTSRYRFAGRKGAGVAKTMLDRLGGEVIVHGHSIIGTLLDMPSEQVSDPILYADGLVLAIDGGRYDGGPLIVVRLD